MNYEIFPKISTAAFGFEYIQNFAALHFGKGGAEEPHSDRTAESENGEIATYFD